MSDLTPPYTGFLGTWELDPSSCQYEQGDPPRAGTYRIEARDGELFFRVDWLDAKGLRQEVEFSGVPDGVPVAFDGGELADSFSVEAISPRELRSSAFYKGKELMVAQRQLDETGDAMRVVQLVRLPDGTEPMNVSVYRRQVAH